jgi:hypothetical protein
MQRRAAAATTFASALPSVAVPARMSLAAGGAAVLEMKSTALAAWLLVSVFAACSPIGVTAQAGFTQMTVGGDIALATGTGGTGSAPRQDVGTAFGLGDPQGSPYLRAQADLGTAVLTASGFLIRESGRGELDASFGGLPASTPVFTDLQLGCAKLSCTFDIDLGLVKVSPGLAMDVFDIRFRAEEQTLGNAEEIDEVVGVPLLFLRAEGGIGVVDLTAEIGYLEVPRIDSAKGRFLDAELMASVSVLPLAHLFAGYRHIDLDATGDTGTDSFGVDLQVRGWMIGGGLRF